MNQNPPPQIGADRQRANQQLELSQPPVNFDPATGQQNARTPQGNVSGIPGANNRIQSRRARANESKQLGKGGENNTDMK